MPGDVVSSAPRWLTAVRQESTPQKVLPDVCKTFNGQIHANCSIRCSLVLLSHLIYQREL